MQTRPTRHEAGHPVTLPSHLHIGRSCRARRYSRAEAVGGKSLSSSASVLTYENTILELNRLYGSGGAFTLPVPAVAVLASPAAPPRPSLPPTGQTRPPDLAGVRLVVERWNFRSVGGVRGSRIESCGKWNSCVDESLASDRTKTYTRHAGNACRFLLNLWDVHIPVSKPSSSHDDIGS